MKLAHFCWQILLILQVLVAANIHPSPVPYADFVTSTTHKTLRGPRGGLIMCKKEYGKKIDAIVFPGIQGGPLMHVIAAKAVAFKEALSDEFKESQKQTILNAQAMSKELIDSRIRYIFWWYKITICLLVDLRNKNIAGKAAQNLLEKAGIILNRNIIPFDDKSAFEPSGIRIGTPTITSRGMKEKESKKIAEMIDRVLSSQDDAVNEKIKTEVREICTHLFLSPI